MTTMDDILLDQIIGEIITICKVASSKEEALIEILSNYQISHDVAYAYIDKYFHKNNE